MFGTRRGSLLQNPQSVGLSGRGPLPRSRTPPSQSTAPGAPPSTVTDPSCPAARPAGSGVSPQSRRRPEHREPHTEAQRRPERSIQPHKGELRLVSVHAFSMDPVHTVATGVWARPRSQGKTDAWISSASRVHIAPCPSETPCEARVVRARPPISSARSLCPLRGCRVGNHASHARPCSLCPLRG